MKKKTLSMNRTIAGMMLIGYAALLVLLLVISLYWISNTQRAREDAERNLLAGYVRDITEGMDVLDKHVYDTYTSNQDFLRLSGVLTETENYQSAYYLQNAMQSKQTLEQAMHGYVIYYDRLSRNWYRTSNIAMLSIEQMREIVDRLRSIISAGVSPRSWTAMNVGNDTVLAVTCRRDNAAIAALYNVSERLRVLSAPAGETHEIVLLSMVGASEEAPGWAEALMDRLPDSDGLYEAQLGGRRVYAQRLPKVNLWVVMSVRLSLWRMISLGQIALLAITAASIIAAFALYRFLRMDFIRPMRELTRVMESIRSRELSEVPMLDVRFREIREVNETLSSMVAEIETQKLTIYEEIIERQKAELQFLQLQLRPHFYLNSLKTINALAINGNNQGIQDMVHTVSSHLRYLFQESHMVRLRDELNFVRNYLAMQDQVHGRLVQVEYDVDPDTLEWQVPILCVQTFVENSVKYARTAIAGMTLRMTVRADLLVTEDGRYIDLMISDNCQGYSDEVLERVNRGDFGDDGLAVGIGNIIRRCRLLYGARAELRFYNEGGAVSELILPELTVEAKA